jgi:hypothetical protein
LLRVVELVPEVVQDVTEVRPRLRLRRVWPQYERETLAGLWGASVEKEVEKQ